jgi:adenylosuccinate lyase
LARLIRGYLTTALENVPLWHERDISHSSAERVILPDATTALDYILNLFIQILDGLVIDRERMIKNMELSFGLYASSKVLVCLMEKGVPRDRAYEMVQACAMKSWNQKRAFADVLAEDQAIGEFLSAEEIKQLIEPKNFLKNIDVIYSRVFGPG